MLLAVMILATHSQSECIWQVDRVGRSLLRAPAVLIPVLSIGALMTPKIEIQQGQVYTFDKLGKFSTFLSDLPGFVAFNFIPIRRLARDIADSPILKFM